jgi:hypothetical protein
VGVLRVASYTEGEGFITGIQIPALWINCSVSDFSIYPSQDIFAIVSCCKDVEKELGISYPTVRNCLDRLVAELGYGEAPVKSRDEQRYDVLEAVRDGRISSKEAVAVLRDIR